MSIGNRRFFRNRQIGKVAVYSAVARFVGFSVYIALVPLMLNHLGVEGYGLWVTITATIALLGFADLGIGNGLLNEVALASARNDIARMRTVVSSGYATLSVVSMVMLAGAVLLVPLVDWTALYRVSDGQISGQIESAVLVAFACFSLSTAFSLINRVQLGLQLGHIGYAWQIVGSVCVLISTYVVVSLGYGLPWVIAAFAGTPVLFQVLNTVWFFTVYRPQIKPDLRLTTLHDSRKLIGSGALFFVIQIAGVVAFQSDVLILARLLGQESVAQYSIAMQLFSIPAICMGFYFGGLWPAYRDAYANRDFAWLRATYLRSLQISIIFCSVASVMLVLSAGHFIQWWAGGAVVPSSTLLVALGLWCFIGAFGANLATIMNGLGLLKFQAITGCIMALTNIIVSIYLVGAIGSSGVVYGSVISLVVMSYVPSYIYVKYYLDSLPAERVPATTVKV